MANTFKDNQRVYLLRRGNEDIKRFSSMYLPNHSNGGIICNVEFVAVFFSNSSPISFSTVDIALVVKILIEGERSACWAIADTRYNHNAADIDTFLTTFYILNYRMVLWPKVNQM